MALEIERESSTSYSRSKNADLSDRGESKESLGELDICTHFISIHVSSFVLVSGVTGRKGTV